MKKTMKKKLGFSLVEVAIAVAILAVTIATSYRLVNTSLASTTHNGMRLQAYYLASEGIEAVMSIKRTDSYGDIDTAKNYLDYDVIGKKYSVSDSEETLPSIDNVQYKRKVEIEDEGDYKKVTCTVRWGDDESDEKKSVKLVSYVGRN
jgi:prepilin-type N-terminal cleavage/methylation domain-containing protein